MTDNVKENTSSNQAPTGDYPVGYGRPPVNTRFTKGASGNPKGRPRKADDRSLCEEKIRGLVLNEAYRAITVRDGDKTERMPAIQAAVRTLLVQGLKGKPHLLRGFIDLVQETEGKRREEKLELMMKAFDYKESARKERDRCKQEGRPEPSFLPDPKDIHIDPETGTVTTTGPVTREQKEEIDELRELKQNCEIEIEEVTRLLQDNPNDPQLLGDLEYAQKLLKKLSCLDL